MVAMDPDTEFNALATLYQSVVADMKVRDLLYMISKKDFKMS